MNPNNNKPANRAAPGAVSLCSEMGLDLEQQVQRRAFIELGEGDAEVLREFAPIMDRHADAVVDGFYANVQRYAELEALIDASGSNVERLKKTQRDYLMELFSGDYGSSYFERRLRIGVVHHRIGLTPRWYLGSYSVYMNLIMPVVLRHWWWRPLKAMKALKALAKLLSLDSQLAIETYVHNLLDELRSTTMQKDDLEQRVSSYLDLINRVSQGDLTSRLKVEGDDDLANLGSALNQMVIRLGQITGKVTESSNAMLATAEQVNAAVASQSSGANEQAAAVTETTSTLEQIKAISEQTQDKARYLYEVAVRARDEGDQGLSAVQAAVTAMQDIHSGMDDISVHISELTERVQQIGEITSTVTDLSQQSKMLALNASIEAAKAGEAGRGFAVVAEEVRDLAEQSRLATAQVQRILDELSSATRRAVRATDKGHEDVNRGSDLARRAGSVLENLNKVIHDTALASQQIVAAVQQEGAGVEQIRQAMSDINKVTGQFVAATQQTEAASDQMTDHASLLQGMVRHFKVDNAHFDFELARAAHRTWVRRLEAFLAGREKMSEQEAISHHHCELGQWYDGEGMARYGHLPQMHQLMEPHRQMHAIIRDMVVKVNVGEQVDKEQALLQVRSLSERIIGLLDDIEQQAQRQPVGTVGE